MNIDDSIGLFALKQNTSDINSLVNCIQYVGSRNRERFENNENNYELFEAYKNAQDANEKIRIRNLIVTKNMGIVYSALYGYVKRGRNENTFREYTMPHVANEDMFTIACITLMLCVEKFDHTKGVTLMTYAMPAIEHAICKYWKREIAPKRDLGQETENVEDLYNVLDLDNWYVNPQASLSDAELRRLSSPSAEEEVLDNETRNQETKLKQMVQNLLENASLTEKQQEILLLHIGLKDGRQYSFEEIGQLTNTSRQNCHNIYNYSLMTLRKYLEKHPKNAKVIKEALGYLDDMHDKKSSEELVR